MQMELQTQLYGTWENEEIILLRIRQATRSDYDGSPVRRSRRSCHDTEHTLHHHPFSECCDLQCVWRDSCSERWTCARHWNTQIHLPPFEWSLHSCDRWG